MRGRYDTPSLFTRDNGNGTTETNRPTGRDILQSAGTVFFVIGVLCLVRFGYLFFTKNDSAAFDRTFMDVKDVIAGFGIVAGAFAAACTANAIARRR